jgi:hypothetical protein
MVIATFTSDTFPAVPVPLMVSPWHFPSLVLPEFSFQHTTAAVAL